MNEKPRRHLLPYVPILLTPVALLSTVLFTGKALFWGTPFLQFIPWRYWAWTTLLAGQNPLWNPLVGMGTPLAANYQSALFYPPNWLLIPFTAAGLGWFAWSQTLLVAAHLMWAGVGMIWLMRDLGVDELGQAVSGLAFSLSGYLVARAGFFSINAAVAWLPWVLWAGGRIGEGQSWIRRSIPLALCTGMLLLAGHAQTAWYTLLLLVVWTGFWGAIRWGGIQGILHTWVLLAPGVMLGVALAAVQLIPTYEYLQQSQRANAVAMDFALTYSFFPWQFLGLVAPGVFGSPVSGDFWGYGNYWEETIYMGMLPFIFAVFAVFQRKQKVASHQKVISGGVILLGMTIIWALGKFTPIFPFLFQHIPSFNMFQAPVRVMIWLTFVLAVLAGIGISGITRPMGRALIRTRRGIAISAAVILAAGGVWLWLPMIKPSLGRSLVMAGVWALGAALLLLKAPAVGFRGSPMGWKTAVVIWTAADLLVAGWGLNPGVDQMLYTQSAQTSGHASRIYLSTQDEYRLKFERFLNFRSFDIQEPWQNLRHVLLPNAGMLEGVATVNNFDPLLPARYVNWMNTLEESSPPVKTALMALMDVEAVESVEATKPYDVSWTPIEGGRRVHFAVDTIPATDDTEALKKTLSLAAQGVGAWDEKVVIEGNDLPGTQGHTATDTSITMQDISPDSLTMKVHATIDGWLVLSDLNYPGWQVLVDGVEKKIYPANYLFRTVHLTAGEHLIVWRYRPISFQVGGAISAAAVVLLMAAWLVFRRRAGTNPNS